MSPRRHVRMFKPEFAPAVAAGTKRCTIRPVPKRAINAGDILDARQWTGRPYNSPQRHLRDGVIERVTPITIRNAREVNVGGRELSKKEIRNLALQDGFAGSFHMAAFFAQEHGLPFTGVLIEWLP